MKIKLAKFWRMSNYEKLNKFKFVFAMLKTKFYYKFFFQNIGKKSIIFNPLYFGNPDYITIGKNTLIRAGSRLEVIQDSDSSFGNLTIGDNVNIEQNVHIVCGGKIRIGNNVSITGNVAIVDVKHPHNDVYSTVKIGSRIQCKGNYIEIEDGVFIGFGSIILPNVKVGKNSVIGAHTIVNIDVPSYCVVGGNPMKILKKYDFESNEWKRIS